MFYLTIFQTHKQAFSFWWTSNHFDVSETKMMLFNYLIVSTSMSFNTSKTQRNAVNAFINGMLKKVLMVKLKPGFVFYWPYERLHDPFPFFDSMEIETLQFLFLTKDKMIGANDQKITINFLPNFLFDSIMLVKSIFHSF